jgi:predicted TIM-barrel fold metal-dependent hydrolase
MGRLPSAYGIESHEFQALLRFVGEGGWMKCSAPYYNTPNGEADFTIIEARVHAFLNAGRERVLWGMNWPHPNFAPGRKPDDAAALQSLLRVLRSSSAQQRVFVDNPARLYGFNVQRY